MNSSPGAAASIRWLRCSSSNPHDSTPESRLTRAGFLIPLPHHPTQSISQAPFPVPVSVPSRRLRSRQIPLRHHRHILSAPIASCIPQSRPNQTDPRHFKQSPSVLIASCIPQSHLNQKVPRHLCRQFRLISLQSRSRRSLCHSPARATPSRSTCGAHWVRR